jgi:outer membrane receptor protein involved in Fe transport
VAQEVAQNAAGEAAQGDTRLEDIIVTATKRSTTLQQTPISITAVTGDDLLQRGITDISSLAAETPGVSFQSLGPGRTNFNIRGLSDTGGSSPTVGFYLDEIPITPSSSAISSSSKSEISPDLYDLARVEVLRGPQGTLYGAGSEGGTIRLLTNQPKLGVFEASGQTTLSGTEHGGFNYGQNAMINVPLDDRTLAARVVLTDTYDSGFLDRIVVAPFPQYTNNFTQRGDVADAPVLKRYSDVNDTHTLALRGMVLWQPSENLSVTPSVFTQKITQNGQNSFDNPPGTFAHYEAGDIPESFEQNFEVLSLNVKANLGPVTLQSTTSHLHVHTNNVEDVDEQWYGVFLPYGSPFLTTGNGQEAHEQRQLSEELRLASNGSAPLQWIVGAFYNDFKDNLTFNEGSSGLIAYDGSSAVFDDQEADHQRQTALFGEATYELTPAWKLSAGLRYFHYDYFYEQIYSGLATAPPNDATGSTGASGVTPKIGLTYTPSVDLTVFANAAKGFRPGAANLPIPPSFCGVDLQSLGVSTFRPDSVWSYEVGEKARLLDGKLRVRGSLYLINWSDIQQNIPLACGFGYTANAGNATSKGGELEVDAKIAQNLALHESVGYTHAEITSSSIGAAAPVGSPLANVPEWTANSALDFHTELSSEYELNARLEHQFIGSEYDPNAIPYPVNHRSSYSLVNARVGIERSHISVHLFADNLLNKVGIVGFDRSEAENTPQFGRYIPTRPRTIGLDFQYHL